MQQSLTSLPERLAPAEELFFTWLVRVIAAATLIGCAWIDDAPPLELAAWAVTLYVVFRVLTQFGPFAAAAPFEHRVPKVLFALGSLGLLGLSFLTMVTFVDRVASAVV